MRNELQNLQGISNIYEKQINGLYMYLHGKGKICLYFTLATNTLSINLINVNLNMQLQMKFLR